MEVLNMKRVLGLVVLLVGVGLLMGQSQVHFLSAGNPYPVWQKITVTNSSTNLTVTCVPATVNCGTATVAKAAATTQSVTLYTLPANGYIVGCPQVKTTTAFVGPTTLASTVGVTGALTFFFSVPFDMKAAVTATNFAPVANICIGQGSNTRASTAVILALTTTIDNVSTISAGVVEVQMLISVLQ